MKKKYIQPTTKIHSVKLHSMLATSIGTDNNDGNGYEAGGEGNPILGKEENDDLDFGW